MRGKNFYYATLIVGITAVLTVGITLKLSRSRRATPVPTAPDTSLLARATTPADEYRGAQKETIKVHGHWTIDVRNPDGTLVTHREFENGLVGAATLAQILARQKTPGAWAIFLNGDVCNGPPGPQGNTGACVITEQSTLSTSFGDAAVFFTLTVDMGSGATASALVLNGNATAVRAGAINSVTTYNEPCNSTLSPVACRTAPSGITPITSTTLASPVNVAAGQIVQVSVVISFS
jgi:hypothetical protein